LSGYPDARYLARGPSSSPTAKTAIAVQPITSLRATAAATPAAAMIGAITTGSYIALDRNAPRQWNRNT